ncbi:hypothetical protein GCM10007857_77500 [Bradyrhizobium iriomotense]|uniref:Uncharacterized protein n=1 Tax=Bradyrhizobium iriomotense TaxID=441950 RepID=A0ABQ6B9H1_9BRAD|nr:hypothetical protein GCM10007857_77500 [Bradyrhizobium iriomotense]
MLNRQECLARSIALGDLNSLEPVVADHATPDRVIKIENEAPATLSSHGADDPADVLSI